ncbi:MAG: DUF3857 and transglutaminase domain-containing protein [Bacteroidia bacterium]
MQNTSLFIINRLAAFAILLIGAFVASFAQFSAADIPDSLLANAHAVIRKSDHMIVMKSDRKSETTIDQIITILNRHGDEFATIYAPYDKFYSAKDISGEIYDASGALVRKLKPNDIQDVSPNDGSSFISDHHALVATLKHDHYPYTVHLHYTMGQNGLFSFPPWYPQFEENLSVEKARLEIIASEGQEFRFKALNLNDPPQVADEKGNTHYLWKVGALKAVETETVGPPWRDYVPAVYLAPTTFEIQGYKGSNLSWRDFGLFFHALNKDRDNLPEELKQKVVDMTRDLPTKKDKVQAIYRYLQENTRYVGIQLGLGGWQTFDAEYVYKNGYGDCKALSNYAKSMLKAIEIPSYAVLIKAGNNASDIIPDFSSNQFNHAILCVPDGKDTIWMDCTMNNYPAGYLGRFTEDRHALVVTDSGGFLTRTPASPPEANQQRRKANVVLDTKGSAIVTVSVTATGYQQDELAQNTETLSEREKENWLRSRISAKNFNIKAFTFESIPGSGSPAYRYTYDIDAINWASASGSRFFLAPNQLERSAYSPEKNDNRQQPVFSKYPYWDTDTIEYHLPEGYTMESMPSMPLRVESTFGTYEANIEFTPESRILRYTRSLLVPKTRQPAETYEDYRTFWRDVSKADKIQVVLSSKS